MKMFLAAAVLFMPVLVNAGETAQMNVRVKTEVVIIHHSAGASGNADIFRQYHKKLGWADVGYHYVICNGSGGADGLLQKGREEKFVGAHAGNPKPSRNSNSIGVCLVGADTFTAAQKKALIDLLADICKRYKIKPAAAAIQGHHEKCPGKGLDLGQIIAQVEKKINPKTHFVKAGETLSSIGRLYGLTWKELFAKNREELSNPDTLPIGILLRIN